MITTQTIDGTEVIRIQEIKLLDENAFMEVEERLNKALTESKSPILINFKGVRLVNTSVWGKLFVTSKRCKNEERQLALCGMGQLLRDAVEMLKLDRLISVYDGESEALAALKGGESA